LGKLSLFILPKQIAKLELSIDSFAVAYLIDAGHD
jgi:hypothetical protein